MRNKTKDYYEKNAKRWTEMKTNSFIHEKQFSYLLSLWPKRAHILDIGCAGGIHVPLFLGIGRSLSYHGMDVTESFLKIARSRYPQLPFTKGDIGDKKTLPRKKFDGFFAAAVLMHIPEENWPQMFEHIEYVTKPKAVGYITLPIEHPSGDNADADPRHFSFLTPKEHRSWFKKRGWYVQKSGTLDGFHKSGIWKWYIVQLP